MISAGTVSDLARAFSLAGPSIVITALDEADGPGATLQADRPLSPASMIKVPLAAALCAAWAAGTHSPQDVVTIDAANLTANDAASPLVPGYRATLEELGRLMLTRSDNVATNHLIDALGRAAATTFAHSIGLRATAVRRKLSGSLPLIDDPGSGGGRNAHPAQDAAHLFKAIAQRELPGADWLHRTLGAQEWNEKLSRGLPPGDRFAHKTGDTSEVTHDGGILETAQGRRYVVVVYTSLPSSEQGDAQLGAFMKALREHL